MSDLVGNPEDRFSHNEAHLSISDVKNQYKRFRAHVQKVIRDAYLKHICNIFSFVTENPDPDSPGGERFGY